MWCVFSTDQIADFWIIYMLYLAVNCLSLKTLVCVSISNKLKRYSFTFLLVFWCTGILNYGQSDSCIRGTSDFEFEIPTNVWYWTSFYLLLCRLSVSSNEVFFNLLTVFWLAVCLLLSLSVLYYFGCWYFTNYVFYNVFSRGATWLVIVYTISIHPYTASGVHLSKWRASLHQYTNTM